jgi:hypothetical protein
MTLLTAGPCLSTASIRARYFSARERAVNFPDFIPSWRSVRVSSSSSDGLIGSAGAAAGAAPAARRPAWRKWRRFGSIAVSSCSMPP